MKTSIFDKIDFWDQIKFVLSAYIEGKVACAVGPFKSWSRSAYMPIIFDH